MKKANKKVYQFHWLFPKDNNKTIFVEQREIDSREAMDKWITQLRKLDKPEDAQPLLCEEGSEYFLTVAD